MASCPRCGAQQAERTAFCGVCGALIDRPNTEAPANPGPPQPPPAAARPADRVETPPPQPAVLKSRSAQPVSHDFGDVGIYIVRRFLALVVDLAGIGMLIGLGLIAIVDATHPAPDQFLAVHARDFAIAFGASIFAYLTIAEALFGSTLGKGLFGLGVGRVDGSRLGFARALVRNIFLPLDLAAVGFLVATVTPSRRRIGDLVAGSVVTNARIGRLATFTAGVIAVGAAWLLFANADGARLSDQLLAVAGLQLPAVQSPPLVEQTRPSPSPTIAHLRPSPSDEPAQTPTPTPSADPGRPHTV